MFYNVPDIWFTDFWDSPCVTNRYTDAVITEGLHTMYGSLKTCGAHPFPITKEYVKSEKTTIYPSICLNKQKIIRKSTVYTLPLWITYKEEIENFANLKIISEKYNLSVELLIVKCKKLESTIRLFLIEYNVCLNIYWK